jgi:hypothetical protein
VVRRFGWWKRLEQPTRWTAARRERADERERQLQRKYRRREQAGLKRHAMRSRWWLENLLLRLLGLVLVLASLAIIPLGLGSGRSDERLTRSTPVQQAVVVSVDEDKWSKNHDLTIKVARPGDGGTVAISLVLACICSPLLLQ